MFLMRRIRPFRSPENFSAEATGTPLILAAIAMSLVPMTWVHCQEKKSGTMSGFRFRSQKPAPVNSEKPAPTQGATSTKGSGPGIKLGLASGPARIPPELKELAQKGADAVANGDWASAQKHYLEMVLQAPDNPLAYANLGVAEYQLGNLTAASGNLRRSIDLNPTIAQNWITLGLIQMENGQILLAISSLTRAVHEDPQSAQAHLYLAAATFEKGWIDAAIGELKRVIELEPSHAQAHYNLALTYLGQKPPRTELARRHYYSAIRLGAQPSPSIERFLDNSDK